VRVRSKESVNLFPVTHVQEATGILYVKNAEQGGSNLITYMTHMMYPGN
jgi:hypothetical protein